MPKRPADEFRKICLALPHTAEKLHFGDAAFYVKGRMFAAMSEKEGNLHFQMQLEPGHLELLMTEDPRFKQYRRHKEALNLEARDAIDWVQVGALVRESYDIILRKRTSSTASARKKG